MWKRITNIYSFAVSQQDRIVFFGSGNVGSPTLKKLAPKYENLTVVTSRTQPNMKLVNQVQIFAKSNGLSRYMPITPKADKIQKKEEWNNFINQKLIPLKPKFGVICSFGYMLPAALIQCFSQGMIVVHPSLLPKYRGGAPIFHAIANGEKKTGVSFIEISKGMFDEGPILHQVQCDLNPNATYEEVQSQLSKLAADNVNQVISNIDALRPGKIQSKQEQGIDPKLLKAGIIKSKHLELNKNAQQVYNWSRALVSPRFKLKANDKEYILFFDDKYFEDRDDNKIGTVRMIGKKVVIKCKDKFIQIRAWKYIHTKEMQPGIFAAEVVKSGKYPKEELIFS